MQPVQCAETRLTELIQLLGSKEYQDRENASRALEKRDDAVIELRAALASDNAEVARRAKSILNVIVNRRLMRCLEYGRSGRIDLIAESARIHETIADGKVVWQTILDASWEIVKLGQPDTAVQQKWKHEGFPEQPFKNFVAQRANYFIGRNSLDAVKNVRLLTIWHSGILKGNGVNRSLIVNAGPIQVDHVVGGCIVFSTEGLSGSLGLYHSLVVTDGDIRLRHANNSVVIARGNIRIAELTGAKCNLSLHAGGRVHIESLVHNGRRAPFNGRTNLLEGTEIKEGVRTSLGFVRFFEISDVGIEVRGDGAPKLEKLLADSPMAKAGLKPGDVILAIDDCKVGDCDAVRRMLRRAFVLGGGVLTISRDGGTLEKPVSFAGWELPALKR